MAANAKASQLPGREMRAESCVTEDRDPAGSAETKQAGGGCGRLCSGLLLQQRIAKGLWDRRCVWLYYICSRHQMHSLNDAALLIRAATKQAAGWREVVEDEVRRESKPTLEKG